MLAFQTISKPRKKKHLTKEGILEICDIRDGMNYRKMKCKWTKEEIIKVLIFAKESSERKNKSKYESEKKKRYEKF